MTTDAIHVYHGNEYLELEHKHSRQLINESIFAFYAFFRGELICARERVRPPER